MPVQYISYEDAKSVLSWPEVVDALYTGHQRPKAQIHDLLFGPENGMLMTRAARIEGIGFGIKTESVFNHNAAHGLPNTHGTVQLFTPDTGVLRAVIEAQLITDLKTAADSVLGARLLARPNSQHLVIVGAGVVAGNLARAYSALLPTLSRISIWARRIEQASQLCSQLSTLPVSVQAVSDLPHALESADIVASATQAQAPILHGEWIRPGTHVDLVGAFTPTMRETDDALIAAAKLYVDCHDTTHHIGDIAAPIASGAITPAHVLGDLYDLVAHPPHRYDDQQITVFKNGGGAHLDVIVADCLLKKLGL